MKNDHNSRLLQQPPFVNIIIYAKIAYQTLIISYLGPLCRHYAAAFVVSVLVIDGFRGQ